MSSQDTSHLLTVRHNAIAVSVKTPSEPYAGPERPNDFPNRENRKAITDYGKYARNSVTQLFESVDWEPYLSAHDLVNSCRAMFVTLVCSQHVEHDQYSYQNLKKALNKALNKAFPAKEGVLHKSELQKDTDTPHLHLLLWFDADQNRLKVHRKIREIWCRLNGEDGTAFRRWSIRTQSVYGQEGYPKYLWLYFLKPPITEEQTWDLGKISGVWGNPPVGKAKPFSLSMSEDWTFTEKHAIEAAFLTHEATMERARDLYSRPSTRDRRGYKFLLGPVVCREVTTLFEELRQLPEDELFNVWHTASENAIERYPEVRSDDY